MPSPSTSSSTSKVIKSGITNIDALIEGDKWGAETGKGITLSYSFPWSSGTTTFANYYSNLNEQSYNKNSPLNTEQQNAIQAALTQWSNVTNIIFSKTTETGTNVGDIRIGETSVSNPMSSGEQPWGWAYSPNSNLANSGDIWISSLNKDAKASSWAVGSYNFEALMHEIGHAIGLKHPFDDHPKLPTSLDNRIYTIMSYTDPKDGIYPEAGYTNGKYDWLSYYINISTPMVLDIAAIQYLYGANNNYHTGNDIYEFDPGKPFFSTIWDASGNDTISAEKYSLPCTIDLRPGQYSSLHISPAKDNGGAKTSYDGSDCLGIAYNCTIENAMGGNGDDIFYGNTADNRIDGKQGNDKVIFTGKYKDYVITYNPKTNNFLISGPDGHDTLTSIEEFQFSDLTQTAEKLMAAVADIIAPTVTSFSPADEATNIAIDSNIVITFSEPISRGSGFISLKSASGSIVASYDASNSNNLSINGNTLTINPSADLSQNTAYTLEIPSGSITDLTGNSYTGTSSYNFTTTTTPTTDSTLSGSSILSAIKSTFPSLSLSSPIEKAYASTLQKIINDNPPSSSINTLLVNGLLKLSLIKKLLASQFDTNGDGKINTLSELNQSKESLNSIIESIKNPAITINTDNQTLDAASSNKTFKINADLTTTINNFSSGDKIDLIPSFTLNDIIIDPGTIGDATISIVIVNENTTSQINLSGVPTLDNSNSSLANLQNLFGTGFIF